MIDTVCLLSPYLEEEVAKNVEKECIKKQGVEIKTGSLVYEITTGSLKGSYDSRISIRVMRDELYYKEGELIKVSCKPYLRVECSVTKVMLGHNIYGGPSKFNDSIKWLIYRLEEIIGVSLPYYGNWRVKRVDIAEVYRLNSDAVRLWVKGMCNAEYPRRKVYRYGDEAIYIAGRTTCVKFYHKGIEFRKHDRTRLNMFVDDTYLNELQSIADEVLRCEVEVRSQKLRYDFGDLPTVDKVEDDYLYCLYDQEVFKVLKVGKEGVKLVRKSDNVKKRLISMYGRELGNVLISTWSKLVIYGESEVREIMSKTTYYRHRKLLIEAGVSWNSTDIIKKDITLLPEDFMPVRNDRRRIDVLLPEAEEELSKVAS